jgi:hypothetical protein
MWSRWAVIVWTVVLVAVCVNSALNPRKRSLYLTWMTAGQDWVSGSPLLYEHTEGDGLDIFRYSPLVASLLTPLQYLDERVGNVLWRLLNAGVLLGGFTYWLRDRAPDGGSLRGILFLLIVPLSLGSLSNGQPNPLVIGLLLYAVALAGDERWMLTAVCVALACAIKIYPIAIGLLLVVVYPRQMSWRLALMLLAVVLLPFMMQRPAYVMAQYAQWIERLAGDDRKSIALDRAYRDLWLLVRVGHLPISHSVYTAIQAASAAGCAVLCGAVRRAGVGKTQVLTTVLTLGTCWMMLCGPATESPSFVQLAPALAWAMVSAPREKWPVAVRWLPHVSSVFFTAGVLAGLTPAKAQIDALGGQPLATLLLTIGCVTATISTISTCKASAASPCLAMPLGESQVDAA